MPLPKALQGDKWTERIARTVFPLIIWYAKNGRTITYGDLNKEVVRIRFKYRKTFYKNTSANRI
jgi:hypothetical protein